MIADLDLTFYPQLAGGALWNGVQASEDETAPPLWQWSPVAWLGVDGTIDNINQLTAAGWERAGRWPPDRHDVTVVQLWGQLATVRFVQMPGQSDKEIWAPSADLARVRAMPVTLAFTVPENLQASARASEANSRLLNIAEILPPPQFGELGVITIRRDDQVTGGAYELSDLSEDAQDIWRQMGAALKSLAAPADWWPQTPPLEACIRGEYNQFRESLRSKLLATRGKEREVWRSRLIELETELKRAEALRAARDRSQRDPEAWLRRWEEVRTLAQQLAAAYWNAYQEQQQPDAPESRRRRPRQPQAGIVVKDPPHVSINSNIFAQGIMRALLSGDGYTRYEDRQIAEYQGALAKQGKGQGKGAITITIEPGDGEGWEHVLRSLNRLGDEVVDTFCAVLALAIDTHGVEHITEPMWVATDDILRICQRKQSNRAYTPEQRAAEVENLRTIARAHVRASWPSGRKGREYRIDSAIWDVFGQAVGEYKTITGEPVWERRQLKVGEWAKLLPPLGKETAIMLRKVLEYHSQRDRYAKRLGRYLTLQFRVNWGKHGGVVERKMQTLLEHAGIKPDMKHPGEAKGMIEGALARLKGDGVIGDYSPVVESTPATENALAQIEQRARGWWEVYEQQLWRFEPPDYAREQYRRIPSRILADDDGE